MNELPKFMLTVHIFDGPNIIGLLIEEFLSEIFVVVGCQSKRPSSVHVLEMLHNRLQICV